MAVHDGCTGATFKGLGKQAPLGTVELYNRTVLDTYKVAGAMYTELDRGIQCGGNSRVPLVSFGVRPPCGHRVFEVVAGNEASDHDR